jgi:hypothetical protein
MGRVFLGRSAGGRPVAVKVIRSDLAADPDFRARFRREVAAARKVSGLFTAMVVDADVDAPEPWLATAYVAGPSLAEAVRDHGTLPSGSVLALAAGLAESLAAIHAAGVVHRDLKPSNVLLGQDGPCVIDFGISRAVEQTSLTRAGFVIGSPGFMSPEQAEGFDVGPPSDIFSLGAVLAFAATGDSPFGGGSTAALVYRIVHASPNLDGVPDRVRPLIERCLAKDPAQRPTASELLAEAEAVQPTTGWLPEPMTRMFPDGQAPLVREPTPQPAQQPAPQPVKEPTPPVAEKPLPSVADKPLPSVAEKPLPSVAEKPLPSVAEKPLPSVAEKAADADLPVTGDPVPIAPGLAALPEAGAAAPGLEAETALPEAAAAAAAALAMAPEAETVLPRAEAVAPERETVAPLAGAAALEPLTVPPAGEAAEADAATVAKAGPAAAVAPLAGGDLPGKPRRRSTRSIVLAAAAAVVVIGSVGAGLALSGSPTHTSASQGGGTATAPAPLGAAPPAQLATSSSSPSASAAKTAPHSSAPSSKRPAAQPTTQAATTQAPATAPSTSAPTHQPSVKPTHKPTPQPTHTAALSVSVSGGSEDSCAAVGALHSSPGASVEYSFSDQSSSDIAVAVIDASGTVTQEVTLAQGGLYTAGTAVGTYWVVEKSGGGCLAVVDVGGSGQATVT